MAKRPKRSKRKPPARRFKWTKTEVPGGGLWPVSGSVVWSTPTEDGEGRVIVGKSMSTDMWHVGGWRPDRRPQLAQFPGNEFPSAEKAKGFVQDLAAAHERAHNRAPNFGLGALA